MPRDAIVFGNGLGMALDSDHFSLQNAIQRVGDNQLEKQYKEIISSSAGRKDLMLPSSEDELERLHLIVNSCEYLQNIFPEKADSLLTENGLKLPRVIQSFIYNVALDLFNFPKNLPEVFLSKLIGAIKKHNHNVITLNYDGLLYKEFIKNEICKGYDGNLVDGILAGGFNSSNLERKYKNTFGLYLHLHGSPLFFGSNPVQKLNIHDVGNNAEENDKHIVLTHVNHKMSVIEKSNILRSYWECLPECLREAREVHLFGYSGYDLHLNEAIMNACGEKPLNIIEWAGACDAPNHVGIKHRSNFWQKKLPRCENINVIHADNILEGNYSDKTFLD